MLADSVVTHQQGTPGQAVQEESDDELVIVVFDTRRDPRERRVDVALR